MKKLLSLLLLSAASTVQAQLSTQDSLYRFRAYENPIIHHEFTADPAPVVSGDTVWLFTGHDRTGGQNNYIMDDWLLFSSDDMMNWTEHPVPLKVSEFKWATSRQAYAGHVIEHKGKWYFYVSTNWCGIGVAVADSPKGPFKDALGKPLLTNDDCKASKHSWACIDPAVVIDENQQPWIVWGNRECYIARLKDNMIEIDGEIQQIQLKGEFTEAPWLHRHNGKWYLSFACGWPEKLGYAMADKINGPYEYKGLLSEISGNSNTTHPGIVTFKGNDWLFTHNGALRNGTSNSRSVCLQPITYAADGAMNKCDVTTDGATSLKLWKKEVKEKEPNYGGYLFAYFEGSGEKNLQEHLRFAVSDDAVNWKALNDNRPVLLSDTIAKSTGIRDPHILRGEKGEYLMVATDMHTYKHGWDRNTGIVLMKSNNLTDWTHSAIDLEEKWPEKFKNVKWVWAPQTIYDQEVGKYLVYFTISHKDMGNLDFYCAYVNNDFTQLEECPRFMYRAHFGAIDADILYKDGLYHLFYAGNEKDANGKEYKRGIKQAVAKSLQGPWFEDGLYLDAYVGTHTSVEGSSVFKLNKKDWKKNATSGEDEKYVLMYDLYSSGRYEYHTSSDLFNFTITPKPFTKDFMPRHGSVISITKSEMNRLLKKWGK